jgi:hypothetical protein
MYGNHAGTTLAEAAGVLKPCWQNRSCNNKCLKIMLAQHLLKPQLIQLIANIY